MNVPPAKLKDLNFRPIGLVEQISRILTELILEGGLKGGDQMIEAELQKQFGTSRSPIREAFRVLEKRGLVVLIPRKGAFVRRVTRKDIEDRFPVRATLEALAARQAYAHMTDEELLELTRILRDMDKAVEHGDIKSYREHHFEFHEIFIEASRNDVLIGILEPLRLQGMWFNYRQEYFNEDLNELLHIHHRILEFFKAEHNDRNRTALEDLVRQHIEEAMNKYLEYFGRHTTDEKPQT